ncbi:MAG: hypothetical protein AUI14_26300 [Actinobacteria bacterium 13_2_20CM_2_71_6]|nr:MAG: hypothetical protein AUI14_26300 [Actinobacteria bacterium 13_2_20CM_2_71_6]
MTELPWGDAQQDVLDILAVDPVDVADVVDMLTKLEDPLRRATPDDPENPVVAFNRLYRVITTEILARLEAGAFADREFLTLLDVEFAKRYFDAMLRWGVGAKDTPEAWAVLFRRLHDVEVRSLPAAATGVNAHVHYDLPFALLATWRKLGSGPTNRRQRQDYLQINEVFYEEIPDLRRSFLVTWQLTIDRANGRFDDWYEDRLVKVWRDVAWRDARRLWALREDARLLDRARAVLDHHTALIGYLLLSPVCSFIQ